MAVVCNRFPALEVVMAALGDRMPPIVNKAAALFAIVVGFLIAAEGYRNGSGWIILAGVAALGIGLALFALKISRRNRGA
jgi:membrane-bound ClpP family serine protease